MDRMLGDGCDEQGRLALTYGQRIPWRYPDSMSVVAYTIVCDSPDCPSLFVLDSREHLTISAFATVIGDRMEAAGWTKAQHGNDLCPECSHRPKHENPDP